MWGSVHSRSVVARSTTISSYVDESASEEVRSAAEVCTGSGSRIFSLQKLGVLLLIPIASVFCANEARSQGTTYHYEYANSLTNRGVDAALGDAPFGESVSYSDGAVSFGITDISVATVAKVPVSFGRKWSPFKNRFREVSSAADKPIELQFHVLGSYWEPDIPVISGIYPNSDGWVTGARARCSGGSVVPYAIQIPGGPPVFPYNYWYGFNANVPGYGGGKIYALNATVPLPTDGVTYKFATTNGWRVSCLPTLKNGVGEGFVISLPDGAKYYFDWIASRPVANLVTAYSSVKRSEVYFHATKAVDRFGNTVTYTYDPAKPMRLLSITASDGAGLTLTYDANGKISQATTAGRVWQYKYAPLGTGTLTNLTEVVLPDSSKWKIEGPEHAYGAINTPSFGQYCNFNVGPYTSYGDSYVSRVRITHPSSAVGEFYFKGIAYGYNNTPLAACTGTGSSGQMIGRPKAFLVTALHSKKIYGPGLTPKEWTITYSPSWSYEAECTNGCANTSTTVVSTNDGKVETYVYGNDFKTNAHQLLSQTVSQGGITTRRDITYLASLVGQPFNDYMAGPLGEEAANSLDNPFLRRNRPMLTETTYQDGMIFQKVVNSYDAFARPLSITTSSWKGPPP